MLGDMSLEPDMHATMGAIAAFPPPAEPLSEGTKLPSGNVAVE